MKKIRTDTKTARGKGELRSAKCVGGKEISESEFQKQVIDLAHLYSWRVCHFRGVKTPTGYRTPVAADGAGFPDLVLAKGGLIIFAELKTEKGQVSDAQKAWLKELQGASERVLAVIWRPSDWDAIELALRKGEW